jgi:hypothetical protein
MLANRNQPSASSILSAQFIGKAVKAALRYGPAAVKAGKKVRQAVNSMGGFSTSSSTATAPLSSARVTRGARTKSTFQIPFSAAILQVSTNGVGVPLLAYISAATGTGQAEVGISPDVITSTASLYYPICFPPQISRITQSFSRYQIKPGTAKLSYRGAVPTTVGGSLAFEVNPSDSVFSASNPTYATVATGECTITTPLWAPEVYFEKRGLESVLHTDNLWKYCDFDGSIEQSQIRQGTMFSMSVAGLGLPINTVCGVIFLQGVLEFKDLMDNITEAAARPPKIKLTDKLVYNNTSQYEYAMVDTMSGKIVSHLGDLNKPLPPLLLTSK